ncbi:ketopantoate reductase family protein [Microbaculum marinisediminis]|uniref:2-dehydropantoate 2-reductase n=1 Tax=Microbaculum marinisediminis TaxID=2931392 RepID=A0AAW5R6L3_9HYPH|nr:2-dehydropantoate 2-reductase [Microbaculum sp. A6E488]MCT8974269.1 2-dehydropantoate 2-reductase [Microbaculum sp. A6E488]
MKIAVVGCGAMGSVYAALLADAGHDVLAIDRWAAHVEAINRDGLVVEGASGNRRVRVRAFEAPPPGEAVDLMILAVKSAAAGAAAKTAKPMIGPDTVVLTIQNGLGAADEVAASIDPDRLLVGIAGGFGASLKGPGHAHHNGMQVIQMGAYAGLPFREAEGVAAVWSDAGFRTEAVNDIAAMQWDKLICNVAYSAPCALTGLTVGEAMDDPELGAVSRAAAVEAAGIARARGIALDMADPVARVRAFAGRMPAAKPSMLLDHEAGRPSEIDFINGAIPREAAKVGLTAPVNETLTRLVRMKERAFGPAKGI